jgi:ribosomal protein L37E
MAYDDPDDDFDDEDWHDDDDADATETGHCPECGRPVYEFSDKCPACGYWLSAADRRDMWSGETKPAWVKIAAGVVLVVLVLSLLRLVPIGF